MNTPFLDSVTFPDLVHLITTLLLYLALVRIYGGKHKGLTRGDVSEICALVIVISCVQMVFAGKMVPDFLIGAFAAVVTAFIVNATVERRTKKPEERREGTPSPNPGEPLPERNHGGFVRPHTLLLALGVSVTLLLAAALLTGCGTLGDGKVGTTQIDARQAEKVGLAVADRIGGDKVKPFTTGAKTLLGGEEPAAQPGELVSDGYFDLAGNPLENGVRRVKTFRAIEEIAPPVAIENRKSQIANFQTVPPAAEPSVPHSSRGPSVSSGAGGATDVPKVPAQPAPEKRDTPSHGAATSAGTLNLPPPVQVRESSTTESQGPAQAPGTSGTLSTARLVQVEARIVAVESPIADQLRDAVAVVELVIEGGKVSGRVLSISNTPAAAQLDLKRPHFDDIAVRPTSGGMTVASSEQGAAIQFEASLDENGELHATAIPAAGSPASLFFQRVELAGRPLLNQFGVVITNKTTEHTKNTDSEFADPVRVEGCKFRRVDFCALKVTRKLNRAEIGGDTVALSFEPLNWKTFTGKNGKTIDGEVMMFWEEGGTWYGGQFDSHGVGQTRKTLGNVVFKSAQEPGCFDGRQPARGSRVYFAICNLDGTERTTLAEAVWK